MSLVEERILKTGRMNKEQLEAAVKKKMQEGARSILSAENKVYRDISVEVVGKEDLVGFWLQEYVKKKGGVSGFVQLEDGSTQRLTIVEETPSAQKSMGRPLKWGEPVVLTNCVRKKNIFSNAEFMETTKDTTVKPTVLTTALQDCVSDMDGVKTDGVYALRGSIIKAYAIAEFSKSGVKTKTEPILGRGGQVNLRLIVSSGNGQFSVKIPDEARLKQIIGDDIEWLEAENAIKELADCLRTVPVVAFGRVSTVIFKGKPEEKKVNPYMQIKGFGFVLPVPEKGTKKVDAKPVVAAEDEDDVVEEEEVPEAPTDS